MSQRTNYTIITLKIPKGVIISKGSVVAAGAVVNKSCPLHSLLAGVPALIVEKGVT